MAEKGSGCLILNVFSRVPQRIFIGYSSFDTFCLVLRSVYFYRHATSFLAPLIS
jgi:hypothetical protein